MFFFFLLYRSLNTSYSNTLTLLALLLYDVSSISVCVLIHSRQLVSLRLGVGEEGGVGTGKGGYYGNSKEKESSACAIRQKLRKSLKISH